MIKKIQKYAAYIFLVNNLLFSLSGFNEIATNIFLVLSILILLVSLLTPPFLKNVILHKSFRLYLFLHLINLIYYLMLEIGDVESLKYLSAKSVQLIIFTSTIYFTHENLKVDLIRLIKLLAVSSLFLSVILNFPNFSSRYYGAFFNPNEFAIIMVYGFSLFLITSKKYFIDIVFIILFLIFILLSGSRAALLGVLIAIFINFNFKKSAFIPTLLVFSIIFIFKDLPTISRLFDQEIFFNRKYEIIYAYETFINQFWFGTGLKNYAYIDDNLIGYLDNKIDFGAHNGYLSILVQYGFIFSIAFFTLVIVNVIKALKYLRQKMKKDVHYKFFYFIIIYTLFNGLFENSFSGINFFQGSLFWFVLGFIIYDLKENIKTEE